MHDYRKPIGVYDTIEKAAERLDNLFHSLCDYTGKEELSGKEYYTEGDSFHLETEDIDFYNGYITKLVLNKNY